MMLGEKGVELIGDMPHEDCHLALALEVELLVVYRGGRGE